MTEESKINLNTVRIVQPTGDLGEQAKKIMQKFTTPAAPATEAARYIQAELLPEWWNLFAAKNAGYGQMHNELGPIAQFVDLNRKHGKLRRALWDKQPIGPEDVREVAMDMIGHLFLLIEQIDQDEEMS